MKEKRILTVLFFTLLLDMVGIGMVIPIIPSLFTEPDSPHFLLSAYPAHTWYLFAGLVTALFGLMQFLAAPLLGELSDVYGRKRLLMLGVGVLAMSQVCFGFGIEIGSLALILISRAVAGLAGANFSIAQASIADVSTPELRARNFGLIGAAFGLGFIIGPVLGGWIAHITGNPATPFWFAGLLGMSNMLSVYFFLPETKGKANNAYAFSLLKGVRNIRTAMTEHHMRTVYIAQFLYLSGFTFFTAFSSIFVVYRFGFTEGEVGTFFGFVGLWMVITQAVFLRFVTKRYTPREILSVSLPCLACVLVAYPFVPSVLALYLLVPFLAIAQGFSMANMTAFISTRASNDAQGATLGISGSLSALSQGIIPLLAGFGAGVLTISVPFILGGACVVASLLLLRTVR